ncbi:MAG: hypothetical protein HPY85_09155 [Anaerolineae bacterium]|nr:hypothetical protein [Anaerolineae bacterium]
MPARNFCTAIPEGDTRETGIRNPTSALPDGMARRTLTSAPGTQPTRPTP